MIKNGGIEPAQVQKLLSKIELTKGRLVDLLNGNGNRLALLGQAQSELIQAALQVESLARQVRLFAKREQA